MATLSLYDTTIATSIHALKTLLDILKKAQTHPEASTLPQARLFPDMFPLTAQILIVIKFCEQFVTHLTGRTVEESSASLHEEKTLEELIELSEKTLALLETVSRDEVDGTAVKTTTVHLIPYGDYNVTVEQFVLTYQLPNLYFHLVTAYDILRMKGLDVGKRDYLKNFVAAWFPSL
ncbi:hypothetical protein VTH82DRAFT_6269 [Thermothelomyces myriococcoides]